MKIAVRTHGVMALVLPVYRSKFGIFKKKKKKKVNRLLQYTLFEFTKTANKDGLHRTQSLILVPQFRDTRSLDRAWFVRL